MAYSMEGNALEYVNHGGLVNVHVSNPTYNGLLMLGKVLSLNIN